MEKQSEMQLLHVNESVTEIFEVTGFSEISLRSEDRAVSAAALRTKRARNRLFPIPRYYIQHIKNPPRGVQPKNTAQEQAEAIY